MFKFIFKDVLITGIRTLAINGNFFFHDVKLLRKTIVHIAFTYVVRCCGCQIRLCYDPRPKTTVISDDICFSWQTGKTAKLRICGMDSP
jgi:hypothetical protein